MMIIAIGSTTADVLSMSLYQMDGKEIWWVSGCTVKQDSRVVASSLHDAAVIKLCWTV